MDRITDARPAAQAAGAQAPMTQAIAAASSAEQTPVAQVPAAQGGGFSFTQEKKKRGIGAALKKLKGIKNIELIIAGVVCAVVLLFYFVPMFSPSADNALPSSFSEYAGNLEKNLGTILSEIKGAGKVSVMITFESGVEQVYAYSTDTQTNKNTDGVKETSVTTEKNTIVVSSGQPVVVKEIMPLIKGVLVVADGANNISVKMNILKAVQALLELPTSKIEIFAKK